MLGPRRTPEELDALLKFIIGLSLAATLCGTIFSVLYSLIFVTQPMTAMAPNDAKMFELIFPIATFLTGTLSGIMIGTRTRADDKKQENTPEVVEEV
jgi:hypothetical protein